VSIHHGPSGPGRRHMLSQRLSLETPRCSAAPLVAEREMVRAANDGAQARVARLAASTPWICSVMRRSTGSLSVPTLLMVACHEAQRSVTGDRGTKLAGSMPAIGCARDRGCRKPKTGKGFAPYAVVTPTTRRCCTSRYVVTSRAVGAPPVAQRSRRFGKCASLQRRSWRV